MTNEEDIYKASYWCLRTDGDKKPSVKTSNRQEPNLRLQYQTLDEDPFKQKFKTMDINEFLLKYEWLYNK